MVQAEHRGPLPARLATLRDLPAGLMPDERTLREARRFGADVRQQIERWRAVGEQGRREEQAQARAERAAPTVQVLDAGTLTGAAVVAVGGGDAPPDPGDDPEAPTGAGTAAQPSPAKAPSATDGRPARGEAHVWVPRGLGNAGLLLGLVLDGDRWPDAPTFTARVLGCSDDSVRRHTAELLRLGLIGRRDGWLVATAAGRERLRRCDPLPRRLLRPGVAGRTLSVLRASAVQYGETLGLRANRHGVRGDRERADLAGVHRGLMPKARALLESVGLATFAEVRRGRAVLVRAAAVTDAAGRPLGSHGRPLGDAARERAAATATKRRATTAGTGRVTTARTGQPIQVPSGPFPIQAPLAPASDGFRVASRSDGCPDRQQNEPAGTAVPVADPTRRHRRAPAPVGDVLRELVPDLPAAKANRTEQAETSSERATAELRRLAAEPQAMPRLLRMPAPRATVQLLEAAQVFDKAPKRRAGLAVQVGRVLDPVHVLALWCDVVLARPRNVGAVLLGRLKRAIAGEAPASLLTRCRAAWRIGRFLEAVAQGLDARARSVTPPRTPARSHPNTPATPRRDLAADEPRPIGGASFDDLLHGMGMGDLVARRSTA